MPVANQGHDGVVAPTRMLGIAGAIQLAENVNSVHNRSLSISVDGMSSFHCVSVCSVFPRSFEVSSHKFGAAPEVVSAREWIRKASIYSACA